MYQDKITLERIKLLHPDVREEANLIYEEICKRLNGRVIVRFSQTLRTIDEQDAIYAKGRTKPGPIVTYARGGQSYHNYGLAVDIVLLIDKDGNGTYESASWNFYEDNDQDGIADFEEIDAVFKMYGWKGLYNSKGKRWDLPHFQRTLGYTIKDLQVLANSRAIDSIKYIPGTKFLKFNP